MSNYAVDGTVLSGIADAIRLKRGTVAGMEVTDMANEISLISGGGGGGGIPIGEYIGSGVIQSEYDILSKFFTQVRDDFFSGDSSHFHDKITIAILDWTDNPITPSTYRGMLAIFVYKDNSKKFEAGICYGSASATTSGGSISFNHKVGVKYDIYQMNYSDLIHMCFPYID